ncbi:hypothetical protein Ancab_010342, partial [Ancistrocladus abbreviatus]
RTPFIMLPLDKCPGDETPASQTNAGDPAAACTGDEDAGEASSLDLEYIIVLAPS